MRTHIIAAVVVASAVACEPDAQPSGQPGVQQRDSAGINIVENARPQDGSRLGWLVGRQPEVSIGLLEGNDPYMLFAVTDATILSGGRIVIVNRGTRELRVFDAEGTYLETWGGEGEGPGEFRDVMHIEPLPDDSVIVWGWLDPAMTVFDPAGVFVRTVRSDRTVSDLPTHYLAPQAARPDGSILVSQNATFVEDVVIEIWDADGNLRESLGSHEAREPTTLVGNTHYTTTFGRTLTMEPWGDLIVLSPTDRYEFKAFAEDGTLARIVRRDHVRRVPTDAHLQAYIQTRVDRIPSEMVDLKTQRRSEYQAVPVAEHLPAYTSVMSDALDHLWAEEYEAPGEEVDGVLWTVFDPGGRVLGFVETPAGLEIYEIGADYILGKTEDEEFGVESVQVWRLERSGR